MSVLANRLLPIIHPPTKKIKYLNEYMSSLTTLADLQHVFVCGEGGLLSQGPILSEKTWIHHCFTTPLTLPLPHPIEKEEKCKV